MKTKILALLLVALMLFCGCKAEAPTSSLSEQKVVIDWEGIIKADFFAGDSEMEKAITAAVIFEVEQKDDTLLVTVKAPDICEGLLEWMEQVSDEEFTEAAMAQTILRLLKEAAPEEHTYDLDYIIVEEIGEISYSAEFTDAMSCGLNRFYAEVTQRILDEMGDNVA